MFDVIPKNNQTWLICGGRAFADKAMFDSAMGDLIRLKGMPETVVHGGATGADEMATLWCNRFAIPVIACRPDWKTHGKAAGPIRNQKMLDDYSPDLVVAFPGGRGTANMVSLARKVGIDVAEIKSTVAA